MVDLIPAALLPAGAPTPSWGVVVAFALVLLLVVGVNTLWELLNGPPNP